MWVKKRGAWGVLRKVSRLFPTGHYAALPKKPRRQGVILTLRERAGWRGRSVGSVERERLGGEATKKCVVLCHSSKDSPSVLDLTGMKS